MSLFGELMENTVKRIECSSYMLASAWISQLFLRRNPLRKVLSLNDAVIVCC